MAGKGDPKTGGRKKGTPNKSTADFKAAFREHGQEFVRAMLKLTKSEDENVQLKALQLCLDCGYGKAVASHPKRKASPSKNRPMSEKMSPLVSQT